MCGIVGMAGNLHLNHGKIFRDMLVYDFVRGQHSTGVAFVNLKGEIATQKDIGHPQNLWDYESDLFSYNGTPKAIGRVWLGHNRHATIGEVNYQNAHPFTYGNITGVHNGSLRDWGDLPEAKTFDVDSKALINSIDQQGIAETWKSFLGAAALVWWDETDGTLNFIRNTERPLYYATNTTENVLIWASEYWMITVACSGAGNRGRMDLKKGTGKDSNLPVVQQFKEHVHYKFEITATGYKLISETPLEKKSVPYRPQTNGNGGHIQGTSTNYAENQHKFWARGLEKAGKEFVGTVAKLVSINHPFITKPDLYTITLRDEQNRYFHVYPSDKTNKAYWELMLEKARKGSDQFFQLTHRPRIKNVTEHYQGYAISADGVKFHKSVLVKKSNVIPLLPPKKEEKKPDPFVFGPCNQQIPQSRWFSLLNNTFSKGCCSGCDKPITIEDAHTLKWGRNSKFVFCEECKTDEELMRMVERG